MQQEAGYQRDKKLYLCVHCGEEIGFIKKQFCKFCVTKEKRETMDAENVEIMQTWNK